MPEFPWTTEADDVTAIEFVEGPRAGEVASSTTFPESIPDEDGSYRRSVRCADDRALRYVWEPARIASEPL